MKTEQLIYSSRHKIIWSGQLQFLKRSISVWAYRQTYKCKEFSKPVVKIENYEHVYIVGAKRKILIFVLVTFFRTANTSWD